MIYTVLCGSGCDQYKKENGKFYARWLSDYGNTKWKEISEQTYRDNELYFTID